MLFTVRTGLLALVFAAACDGAPQPPGADLSRGSGGTTSPVTARGVELRVPVEGGDVVISADTLTLGGDRRAVLEGGVRAVLAIDGNGLDAGATRD